MTGLRLLVTGRTESHVLDALRRATAVLDDHAAEDPVEIVVITRSAPRRGGALAAAVAHDGRVRLVTSHHRDELHLLDAGLFLRPLPTAVALIGDRSPWVADLAVIVSLLVRAGVGSAIAYGTGSHGVPDPLRHGGIFAAGPLCAAGGFAGDVPGARPVTERLNRLGYATLELADRCPELTGSVHRHLVGSAR